jgi:Flp pilus assembly pilin Flp
MNAAARRPRPRPSWQNALAQLGDESGEVALEYGLIAALIVLAILGTIVQLGDTLFGLPLQSLVDAFQAALS